MTRPPSVVLEAVADGAELVVPNAALLSWVQQATGQRLADLFADDEGTEPWREINELVAAVCRALGIAAPPPFDVSSPLSATPRSDDEDATQPTVSSSAVLGLFPVSNQGLLSDMQALVDGEPMIGPLQSFLTAGAELGLGTESAAVAHDVASERCVGAADPCQLRAVRLARQAAGLVIHGPPGTGKSQTITNIIADHLAAGERVLFVCDKRTALDVVHYRLEHLGLGQLCAIVHDARRDARELYRSIREQLDALPDAVIDPGSERAVAAADRELRKLHAELAEYADATMQAPGDRDEPSLHQLAGAWFAIDVPEELIRPLEDVALSDLAELERDTREVLERGLKESFATNPWTTAAGLSLHDYLARPYSHWEGVLSALGAAAKSVDQATGAESFPFDPDAEIAAQARARATLAQQLGEAMTRGCSELLAKWAAAPSDARARATADLDSVAAFVVTIKSAPLERELQQAATGSELRAPELTLWLGKLASYLQIARKWYRFFFFGRRKDALHILQRFGLALSYQAAARVQTFVESLRARRLVHDWYTEAGQGAPTRLLSDAELTKAADDHTLVFQLLAQVEQDAGLRSAASVVRTLLSDASRHGELVAALLASQQRARAIEEFDAALRAATLIEQTWRTSAFRSACANQAVHPEAVALVQFRASVEGILRIRERLHAMPPSARALHIHLLDRSVAPDCGWAALRKSVLFAELSRRIAAAPVLQQLDGDRIRANYERYRTVEQQRRGLTRNLILHRWTERQRAKLLASTGSRLNSAGAEVKRRLVMRGERAMRLRQVIAAGSSIEGGDPLFDLRPVWMASPEVVAQIFPRAPVFDLIVFDEASQCRLEEALPVLTRARRVVIAGDPKQLPPTRFFELVAAQSQADSDAETEQDLFETQQAEAEDMLAAALNLPIEQAYLDVHYRSQNADLIQFSNRSFYDSRLQPIPAHPSNWRAIPPLRLVHAAGTYDKRANLKEAQEVVRIVRELLSKAEPPSIGIACFNLMQRDAIVEALDLAAAEDAVFGTRLAAARVRRGAASFEGLFVKNLENVQGDERDHIIISTTYGPDNTGRFYRRFGPLAQAGGGRRLNVLVTRAREAVHIVTSIPREVYRALPTPESGKQPNGAWLLFSYLGYAESLARAYASEADRRAAHLKAEPECRVLETRCPSELAAAVGHHLAASSAASTEVHWGNDGFSVDIAMLHPDKPEDITIGVLCDVTRFDKAPDRVQWDMFRTEILEAQGWQLTRLLTPAFFRNPQGTLAAIAEEAQRRAADSERHDTKTPEARASDTVAN